MVTDDLSIFTQNEDRFGECIARTKRILSKLLFDWTRENNNSEYMFAIPFDKLSEFFCRVWDELNNQGKVRYASGLSSRRGFHGPGRAISIDRVEEEKLNLGSDPDDHRHYRWAFTLEIIEKLKPIKNARSLFRISGENHKPRRRVYPNIDQVQWQAWLSDDYQIPADVFLLPIEVEYVNAISQMIRPLDQKGIRVIGTHHCAKETAEDIKFNLRAWERRFVEIVKSLRLPNPDIQKASYQLITTSREVKKKSSDNRKDYQKARDGLLNNCTIPDVINSVSNIQKVDSEIWNDNFIERVRGYADTILNFSIYIRRGLSIKEIVGGFKLAKTEIDQSNKAYQKLSMEQNLFVPLLNLRPYSEIAAQSLDDWVKELITYKNFIIRSLPLLYNSN